MTATIRAAVSTTAGKPLEIKQVELVEPTGRLVRVRLTATGVCHSDYHARTGDWTVPQPLILGHEGAGVVDEIGPDVTRVKPGDHVGLSWFAPCGSCPACHAGRAWLCSGTSALDHALPGGAPAARLDGMATHTFLGLGTFAESVVVPETAVVRLPEQVPPGVAALIGCAVATGVGAVLNTATVRPGESAVVVGIGGVGQAILLGLRLVGADPIIAIDLSDQQLEQAKLLGATHTLRGDDPGLVEQVHQLTRGGADYAFEAIGAPSTIATLPELTARGGGAVLVGMPAEGATVSYDPFMIADSGRRILGCNYGSGVPARDFPQLARLYLSGRLDLDALIGATRPLSQVERAFDDLRDAVGLRTILIPEENQ